MTDWTEHATCRGMDLSHFFPVRGQSLEPAKAACARYPTDAAAQEAFLKAGGPQRDSKKLDPDGDGFACGFDPTPFQSGG